MNKLQWRIKESMTQTKQAKHTPMITLSKGGTSERTVKLETLNIPDCWNIAYHMRQNDLVAGEMVDKLWHLAHDLQRHAVEQAQVHEELVGALQECLDYIEAEHAVRGMLLTADEFDWNVKHNKGKLGYVKIAANSTHQGVKADLTKARTAIAHATGE